MTAQRSLNRVLQSLLAMLLLASLAACGNGNPSISTPDNPDGPDQPLPDPDKDPEPGQSSFVSADGRNGEQSQDGGERDGDAAEPEADEGFDNDGGDERSVEEGDIYRVLADGRILNLNAFRGLQIIDFTDVDNPTVEGRVQVTGYPVELYTVGDRAFVLMNDWRGYWRSNHDTRPETYQGGLVMVVDISDRANPRITGQAQVPGHIRTSRLTRGGGQEALYVVSNHWGYFENEEGHQEHRTTTYVKSFSVSERGELTARTEIDLGGYVGDIQATGNRLMVSRIDYNNREPRSRISLIDISSPDGSMVEGGQVEVRGYVANKYNMDVHGDVMRIVSGSTWGGTRTNHVQTYDASDIHNLEEIDHATFGDEENLFATLFMGNKAFFVTYRQVDPFHAFEITDEGRIYERAEYIISGWNNFFRPVSGGDRLIGIGFNDENGRTLAVSLYDTTDLSNPEPFIERQEVDTTWSWSEAAWDDRAFSVLENAVEIEGPGGVTETGMVMLPFSGWNQETNESFAAVQIFTFSDNTLTQRGVMHHGTPVRRSFRANNSTTANLSEAELSLFDHTDPANPAERGRVELAPNYTDVLVFGGHGVRVKSQDYYYWWYRGQQGDELPLDRLEVISLAEHPDQAEALAAIDIIAGSDVRKVGQNLVVTHMAPVPDTNPVEFESTIEVYDLSTADPRLTATLTTDQLHPSNNYYGYYDDCWDCWGWGRAQTQSKTVGEQALVYTENIRQERLLGTEEVCYSYPTERHHRECWDENGARECTYTTGNRVCRSLEGAPMHCTGSFYRCHQDTQGRTECEELERGEVEVQENCYEHERYRYWSHYRFNVLDLSDPNNPVLGQTLDMPSDEESAGLVTDGDDLYVSYSVPVEVENDPRPFVRYFFKRVDLSNPSAPEVARGINVPGHLLAVYDDGQVVVTQDTVWGEEIIEAAINKLSIVNGRALLDGRRRLHNQYVQSVALDERGNLLVNHRSPWSYYYNDQEQEAQKLTIMSVATESLSVLAETDVDIWAQLQDVRDGRALFQVPGGLLVMNLDEPSEPEVQSYFPTRGWPRSISLHNGQAYFAAGRYGLYRFDLNTFNIH